MGLSCLSGSLAESLKKTQKTLNTAVSGSIIGKYFKLEERMTCFTRELRAATTTFLSMAYVVSVVATVLSESGGTCSISDCSLSEDGTVDWDCRSKPNAGYEKCMSVVKNDLIMAISLASMLGCFAMGVLANLPFGLAPGTGQSMYMTYNLVGVRGSGPMSYRTALGLWLAEAILFIAIAASGLRSKIARLIPMSVRLACAVGIGLFMALVGLQAQQGVGLIGPDPSTLVTITACARTDPDTGRCVGGKMRSPTFWLGSAGFLVMSYGLMNDVRGSMIYGILFVTVISWIRATPVTYFPTSNAGEARYRYFKKIVDFHKIETIAGKISFRGFKNGGVWVSLLTLLYIDILATTGGLYTLAEIGGFTDGQGTFENEYMAYMIDAIATVVGTFLGVTPISTYTESAAGIREGGRTGLTAVIVGVYFLVSLFFAPLLTSVPPWAVGPSLVMVGTIMMKVAKDIDWSNAGEAVPAFVTIILMPLTSSIPNGIIGGFGIYVALHSYRIAVWLIRKMKKRPSGENDRRRDDSTCAEQAVDAVP
ncbi:hypothetical protein Nepgr_023372 [Nepenthes gracilis]|uniref:Adenine/guanine permease AZG2 n=1 Tax=Nepenthes gracilis TaxID=150966 RepID=A0AAD3T143_NEPGR|nr:hypothetical protein Nepgr_023372 [Nepenthes gracilis]